MSSIPNFIWASLVTSYPEATFSENVDLLLKDPDLKISSDVRDALFEKIKTESSLDELRSEYLKIFDSGRGSTPLYETEYGRNRVFFKANELSDLAGFYKAFGFEFGSDDLAREMLDHISVELEFYALLLMKEGHLEEKGDQTGMEIVRDARKKFLKDHLGRFTGAILERPGVMESRFYGPVFQFCDQLVKDECKSLDVVPEKISWLSSEQETGEVSCGGTVGCLK